MRMTYGFAGTHLPIEISTHAPLRGATCPRIFIDELRIVSTHAPLRDATCPLHSARIACLRFNTRTPAGCDAGIPALYVFFCRRFNTRTPAGCDIPTL